MATATRNSERRFAVRCARDTRAGGLTYFSDTEPQIIARTTRLVIRHLAPADLDPMFELCSDAELMRYIGDGAPLKRTDVERWIRVSQKNYARRGFGCFGVEDAATTRLAGYCGLVIAPEQIEVELIYALRRAFHEQGIATEAARAVIKYGFDQFGLPEIIATIDPANTASRHILEKIGLRYDGERRDNYGADEAVFRILRAEFSE